MKLNKELTLNVNEIEYLFENCGDVVKRRFTLGAYEKRDMYLIYVDNMTSREMIEYSVLTNLQLRMNNLNVAVDDYFKTLLEYGFATADLSVQDDFESVEMAVLSGDAAFLVDGYDKVIILSCKGWPSRGVPSSDNEVTIQGSKEAFSEGFRTNTVLIRRRIRDTRLKVEQFQVGRRSHTDVALMYLADVVRPEVLEETKKRVQNIDVDSILDSGQLSQLIDSHWASPFPQSQFTERPDKAASAILEGRVVIVVDNTPFVLMVPVTLNTFFQASDDYYQGFEIASFVRMLRFISGFVAMALPGLYIALTAYHPSMIPMELALKMAGGRMRVPFPGVVEILIMELAFELLREAGLRLPTPIGSTIGIVGGIVIGQAVVEAGIIAPIVVVVVSVTAIASFMVPNNGLVATLRLVKYFILFLSSIFGLYGFLLAFFFILIHLVSLKSYGIPYMMPFCASDVNRYEDIKDSLFRAPFFMMRRRPYFANRNQQFRMPEKENLKRR